MDVDVGFVVENSGTGAENSGTRPDNLAEPMEEDEPMPLQTIKPAPKWAQGIMSYMEDGDLPSDEVLARQIQRRSKSYVIYHGELHKKSVTSVLQ